MNRPELIMDLDLLRDNARTLIGGLADQSIGTWAVTKVLCGDPVAGRVFLEEGARGLADSRLENINRLRQAGLDTTFVLLRIAAPREAVDVVRLADISLQSEPATLEALDRAAAAAGKPHAVVLMADLGDLREGVPEREFLPFVGIAGDLPNLVIAGVGTNLTCYGGVIPDESNLGSLAELHKKAEKLLDRRLPVVSGGNSSSLHLWTSGNMPAGINNLRLGESLVLGRETAYGRHLRQMHSDIFTVRATVVELKRKSSVPSGIVGMDAFGRIPTFTDRGQRLRAILAIGQQDVNSDGLVPRPEGIIVLGASSDHLIVDVEEYSDKSKLEIGSTIDFTPDYGALLKAATSPYVSKTVFDGSG